MEEWKCPPAYYEEVTWDFVCNKPLAHITFVLKYFMSETNQFVSQSEELSCHRESIQKKIEEKWRRYKDKVLFVAGYFCGLQPPQPIKRGQMSDTDVGKFVTEKDLILVLGDICVGNKGESCQYYTDTKDTSPGYLRLVSSGQGKYISNKAVKQWFNVRNVDQLSDTVTCDPEHHDIRLSLVCPSWPAVAKEWPHRSRSFQWPPQQLIDDIIQSGCHVIPEPHSKSQLPDVEWMFSFVLAEHKLMKSLSTVQRQCYMTLETLILNELSPPHLLMADSLRNHFFWCLEKIPSETWKDEINGLGSAFQYVVTQLLYALINEKLPHYFVTGWNLIDHIPEEFLDELTIKVNKLHADPFKYILSFDNVYHFAHTSARTRMQMLLKPVLDDCINFHNSLQQCYEVQSKSAYNMCKTFLEEGNHAAAYASGRAITQLGQHLGKDFSPAALMENCLSEFDDPKISLNGLEYIAKHAPHTSETVHEKLACLYMLHYCSDTDETAINDYKRKADESFHKALDIRGPDLTLAIYYSVHLRKCGREPEAIPLLIRAICQQQQRHDLSKKLLPKHCYDKHVQAEFDYLDVIPPVILALYQLIQCYIQAGQVHEAEELMPDFEAACLQHCENCASGYSLLGCANMDLNQYTAAKNVFEKVLQQRPNDNLALRNLQLCEAQISKCQISDQNTA